MTDDAMVPVARILGRGEALTVAAMLDAAGIIVHVGGEYYASVSPDIVAIGGFRLTVPAWQHEDASAILVELLAAPEPEPNGHTARAFGRLAVAMCGFLGMTTLPYALLYGVQSLAVLLYSPLFLLQVPVNPQSRADYYLGEVSG